MSPTGEGLTAFILPDVHHVSGPGTHGVFRTELLLPKWNAADGIYILHYIVIVDSFGQPFYFERGILQQSGYPTSYVELEFILPLFQIVAQSNYLWI